MGFSPLYSIFHFAGAEAKTGTQSDTSHADPPKDGRPTSGLLGTSEGHGVRPRVASRTSLGTASRNSAALAAG